MPLSSFSLGKNIFYYISVFFILALVESMFSFSKEYLNKWVFLFHTDY